MAPTKAPTSDELLLAVWRDLWTYDDETEHFNVSVDVVQRIGARLVTIGAVSATELGDMLAGMTGPEA